VEPIKNKGQFMIISAVIASLIIITLSTTISNIQNQKYENDDLPKKANQVKNEIKKITSPESQGAESITAKEKRNFRKLLGYLENYRATAKFNDKENCVSVTLQSTDKKIEIPCTS